MFAKKKNKFTFSCHGVFILPLLYLHNLLKKTQLGCCMIEAYYRSLLEKFVALRKKIEKCLETVV